MKKKNSSLNLTQKALTPKSSSIEKLKKIITPKATINKENTYHRNTPGNDIYGLYQSNNKNIQYQSASSKYLLNRESLDDDLNNDYLLKDFDDESFKVNEFNKGT